MERVVTCSICGDQHRCFEEMQDDYSSFMCFNCGFMSDTRFTKENEQKLTPDSSILVNKLKSFDEEKQIWWFPSVVNMGKLGIIYPEGVKTNWMYKLAQPRPLTKEEKKDEKYKGHDRILDVENAKEFGQYEFLDALKLMGVVKDI